MKRVLHLDPALSLLQLHLCYK